MDKLDFKAGRTLAFFYLEITKLSLREGQLEESYRVSVEDPKSKPGSQDINLGAISIALN